MGHAGKRKADAHEHPGGCVVLEHDLVDDAAARAPELDAVFTGGAFEEVEDLLVRYNGSLEE